MGKAPYSDPVDLQTAQLEIDGSVYTGFAAAIMVKGRPRTVALCREYGDAVQLMELVEKGRSAVSATEDWRDMADAPKNRTPILGRVHDDLFPRVMPGREDLKRWNGQQVVIQHPGLCEDGFDLGWSVSAPVGCGLGRDDWFSGWLPLPGFDGKTDPEPTP